MLLLVINTGVAMTAAKHARHASKDAKRKHRLSLLLFLGVVLGGGLAIGFLTPPGGWYAGLFKPSFNPPP